MCLLIPTIVSALVAIAHWWARFKVWPNVGEYSPRFAGGAPEKVQMNSLTIQQGGRIDNDKDDDSKVKQIEILFIKCYNIVKK